MVQWGDNVSIGGCHKLSLNINLRSKKMKTKKTIVLLSAIMLITSVNLWAQQQLTVVVRSFDTSGGISQDQGNAITDLFTSELGLTGKVNIVDRNSFEAIIAEMKFGASDWSNNNNVARLGSALNANYIIQGTVTSYSNRIIITVRVLNVSTVHFVATPNLQLENETQVLHFLPRFCQSLALTLTNSYQVGEVGPSGGLVFYDKGSYFDSSGWRYLEAAPASYEFSLEYISGRESSFDPIARISTLNINRLTGWRLPTPDELNLMYGNLKQWNLGGFSDGWYVCQNQNTRYLIQNFNDGMQFNGIYYSDSPYYFRAVRQF
jgi:TolB-like protein